MQLSAKVLSSILKGLLIAIGVVGTAVGVLYCIIQRYYDATIERLLADGSVEIAGETVGIERTDLALEAGTATEAGTETSINQLSL